MVSSSSSRRRLLLGATVVLAGLTSLAVFATSAPASAVSWVRATSGNFAIPSISFGSPRTDADALERIVLEDRPIARDTSLPGYKLVVCLVVQNEERFIDEFLVWHRLTGVDHFVVYNSGSYDNTEDRLLPYVHAGIVTVYNTTFKTERDRDSFQYLSVHHCTNTWANKTEWLAHFDTDEFVHHDPLLGIPHLPTLSTPTSDDKEPIWRFPVHSILGLSYLHNAHGLAIYRQTFANPGIWSLPPDELVTQTQTYRQIAPPMVPIGTKSWLHTYWREDMAEFREVHSMSLRSGSVKDWERVFRNPRGMVISDDNGFYDGSSGALAAGKLRHFATEPFYLAHFHNRDMVDCYFKSDNRAACCPSSWRGKAGRSWCHTWGALIAFDNWTTAERENYAQFSGVVIDESLARSWKAGATARILRSWRKGRRRTFDVEEAKKLIIPLQLPIGGEDAKRHVESRACMYGD